MNIVSSRIPIPTILEVGNGVLEKIGEYITLSGIEKVSLFMDSEVRTLFAAKFEKGLFNYPKIKIIEEYNEVNLEVNDIIKSAYAISKDSEAIVGIGGGKMLDIAKYTAFLNKIPFISVPTSTSNDGFSSSGASLLIDGKRRSISAVSPYGILVDIGIIQSSPPKFIYSGLGDIVSKITAIYDWELEEKNKKAHMNDFSVMIAKKSVNSIVRMPYSSINETFFIKELIDSLIMSGIAMEIAGSSAPASGSEHLISHALDKILEKPFLHGIQVGISTYIMSLVQEHRYQRINTFLTNTGFFDHVKTLSIRKKDILEAIDIAPQIKPNRYTYLHIKEYNDKAKLIVKEDKVLSQILV